MGPALQLYFSHAIVNPPSTPTPGVTPTIKGWHQDSGQMNIDLTMTADLAMRPQPRLSLKVGYFLTDLTEPGRGNTYVVPGSHLKNELSYEDASSKGLPVCAKAGSAIFLDRRVWHASSPNISELTRKVLFYGYSYRWIRPSDSPPNNPADFAHISNPIHLQLLNLNEADGYSTHYWPEDEHLPVRVWLRENTEQEVPTRKPGPETEILVN